MSSFMDLGRPPGVRARRRVAWRRWRTQRRRWAPRLAKIVADLGVGTALHYAVPVPEQSMDEATVRRVAARIARGVLSGRCFAERTNDQSDQVADAVRLGWDRV